MCNDPKYADFFLSEADDLPGSKAMICNHQFENTDQGEELNNNTPGELDYMSTQNHDDNIVPGESNVPTVETIRDDEIEPDLDETLPPEEQGTSPDQQETLEQLYDQFEMEDDED